MGNPWLILDRDDTILDDPGYLSDPRDLAFLPGAVEGLKAFASAGWPLVVISNQSGLGRGLFSQVQLDAVTKCFQEELGRHGIQLQGIYYCPHSPQEVCACRKPQPGLAQRAALDLDLDLHQAVVVGDRLSDIQLGHTIDAALTVQLRAKKEGLLPEADLQVYSLKELAQHLLPQAYRPL